MDDNSERILDLDTKLMELTQIKEEERAKFSAIEEKQKNQLDELTKIFQKLYYQTRNFEEDVEERENEKTRYKSKMVNEEAEKRDLNM
jgi:hypothetical protein